MADPSLDFAAVLLARAEDPSLRKVERTHSRLLAGIARELMAGTDRTELKVSQVTRRAGLAHGTFYRYFPDMAAATAALIDAFSGFVHEKIAGARDGETGSRDRVRSATLLYARLFRHNAGLMRCLLSLSGESLSFVGAYQRLNRDWYKRVAAALAKRWAAGKQRHDALPAAYALGGMIDDFLAQVYLRKEPALASLAGKDEKIAELLTRLWYSGAYGESD